MSLKFIYPVLFCLVGTLSAQQNYLNQGNDALKSGDYSSAVAFYQDAIDLCGEDHLASHNLAVLAAESGDDQRALSLLTACINDHRSSTALYNRAIIHLANKDYQNAFADLKTLANSRELYTGNLEREAQFLKRKAEEKQLLVLHKLAEQKLEQEHYEEALEYYDEAQTLSRQDDYFLFQKALVGLAQKNPFVSLENAEAINSSRLQEKEKLEIDLLRAYSLGRINRMKEGVAILEKHIYYNKNEDHRIKQLLGYYYLRLGKYDKTLIVLKAYPYSEPNSYVIAGNAALYLRKYSLAIKCYGYAKQLDPTSTNAEIGTALCLANSNRHQEAINVIDALAAVHPDNYRVQNTRGIVYKDLGLYYKNRFNDQRAKGYLKTALAAFITAQQINKNLTKAFESNRALALFFLDKGNKAKNLWLTNNELSSQNNLALYYASKKDFKKAYSKLDSLSDHYVSRKKKKHAILDYNKNLARTRTRLHNNYKFITNYFLTQDKPILEAENPFELQELENAEQTTLDFLLEYSDKDCIKESIVDRKKVKKKRKWRLFKRKNKKQKGDCPTF